MILFRKAIVCRREAKAGDAFPKTIPLRNRGYTHALDYRTWRSKNKSSMEGGHVAKNNAEQLTRLQKTDARLYV